MILPLTYHDQPVTTNIFRAKTIHDQTRQDGYETVPFGVYIKFFCLLFFVIKCSESSLGVVVILPLTYHDRLVTTNIFWLNQLIHDQTRQNGYQTVPFGV